MHLFLYKVPFEAHQIHLPPYPPPPKTGARLGTQKTFALPVAMPFANEGKSTAHATNTATSFSAMGRGIAKHREQPNTRK